MRVLVAESKGFSPAAADRLRDHELRTEDLAARADLIAAAADAEVLWVRLRHRIDAGVFEAAPDLRYVVTATTGLNHIDLAAARRHGVRVLSLKGEEEFLRDVRATAELTIALMLGLLRRLPTALDHVRNGGWNRDRFRGGELKGSVVGVVGHGRLGRIVSRYLLAFGSEVISTDPAVAADSMEPGVRAVPLPELLAEARIVSLHVNLCDATTGMFGVEEIAAMRPYGLLVNTSRGELVDEAALLSALEDGRIAGAALDVVTGEHPGVAEDHPLVRYARENDNLLITPHIGGCTIESMRMTEDHMAGVLLLAIEESRP
jgi:phosphoglycerate dehydrogenase-like enzyme